MSETPHTCPHCGMRAGAPYAGKPHCQQPWGGSPEARPSYPHCLLAACGMAPRTDALEYSGFRWNMDCADVFRLARQLESELAQYQAKHTAIMQEADRRYDRQTTTLSSLSDELRLAREELTQAQARCAEMEKDLRDLAAGVVVYSR